MVKIMLGLVIVVVGLSFATVKSVVVSSSSSAADLRQKTLVPLQMMINAPHHLPGVHADLS